MCMNVSSTVSETDTQNRDRVFIHNLDQDGLKQLQRRAAEAAVVEVFFQDALKEGSQGPEMAVIPAAMFEMGSNRREFGHRPEESPQHYVTIHQPFALGRFTITAEEFELFRADTGWTLRPDLIWAEGRFPVMNIRIADAQHYADWLSEQTGAFYRLPTEAEWEYACRAGTLTPFSYGESVSCRDIHFNAAFPYNEARERRRWFLPRCLPMPRALMVGSLSDNPWGLFEMHGNVQEFTSTAWVPHHSLAHRDGSPREAADPKRIVVKGGSWFDPAVQARSAARMPRLRDELDVNLGFRLVRELN
jgi:formylglycine-generating enzyme required for sulfatase activity